MTNGAKACSHPPTEHQGTPQSLQEALTHVWLNNPARQRPRNPEPQISCVVLRPKHFTAPKQLRTEGSQHPAGVPRTIRQRDCTVSLMAELVGGSRVGKDLGISSRSAAAQAGWSLGAGPGGRAHLSACSRRRREVRMVSCSQVARSRAPSPRALRSASLSRCSASLVACRQGVRV